MPYDAYLLLSISCTRRNGQNMSDHGDRFGGFDIPAPDR